MITDKLSSIVANYIKHHQKRAEKELHWFAIQPSLARAVSLAALARGPGNKRFSHQRRLQEPVLAEGRRRLLQAIGRLQRASSFDELFSFVESCIGDVDGIGELTVYDTALRIGAKLNLEPGRVYLHRGTREGARRLGIGSSDLSIPIDRLPPPLRKLKAREIEDVLCIYKDDFGVNELQAGASLKQKC